MTDKWHHLHYNKWKKKWHDSEMTNIGKTVKCQKVVRQRNVKEWHDQDIAAIVMDDKTWQAEKWQNVASPRNNIQQSSIHLYIHSFTHLSKSTCPQFVRVSQLFIPAALSGHLIVFSLPRLLTDVSRDPRVRSFACFIICSSSCLLTHLNVDPIFRTSTDLCIHLPTHPLLFSLTHKFTHLSVY